MARWLSWIAFPLLGCASSCASYEAAWSSLRLRYDATEDTLHVLEQQHGVTHGTHSVASASTALLEVLDGRRRFPPEGGFLSLDCDQTDLGSETWSAGERTAFLAFAAHVKVVEARVVREDDGALGFVRRSTITDLTRALPLVNDWVNRNALGVFTPAPEFVPEFPVFDAETRAAFARAIETGHAWLSVREGAIELDLPMTETNAGQCLAALARGEGQDLWIVCQALASARISDGHARLRFFASPVAIASFDSELRDNETDLELIEALEKAGVSIRDEATARDIVRRFEGPSAEAPAPGSGK